jgi:hypothetical protein
VAHGARSGALFGTGGFFGSGVIAGA